MECNQSYSGVQDSLNVIAEEYSDPEHDPLFLIIHNLDGPMLRAEKTQAALAHLAALPSVHLIASFDHINASLSKIFTFLFSLFICLLI